MTMREWINVVRTDLREWSHTATSVPKHLSARQTLVGDQLYHGTKLILALIILDENTIETGIEHDDEGSRVSCARSLAAATKFMNLDSPGYGVVLSLDWHTLSEDFPIHPYEDHRVGNEGAYEEEECVYGSITPLNKYLRAIYGSPDRLRAATNDERYVRWAISETGFVSDRSEFTKAVEALIAHDAFRAI